MIQIRTRTMFYTKKVIMRAVLLRNAVYALKQTVIEEEKGTQNEAKVGSQAIRIENLTDANEENMKFCTMIRINV